MSELWPDGEGQQHPWDCVVVGGGPAGLTAAIYLARFRLTVCVYDSGKSRAALIPCTRNHAGFPGGISGEALLARMREQAAEYGANLLQGTVDRLSRAADEFLLISKEQTIRARSVLLATGVTNRRPAMPATFHREAVALGRIRYCPVCDGFEVIDKAVAVVGTGEHGLREAEFLRRYTADLALIAPDGPHELDEDARERLASQGIKLVDGPAVDYRLEGNHIVLSACSRTHQFDSIYPAMGSQVHSSLARQAGARLSDQGCITVDSHQRTSIAGLYAAGDVVIGLDQISHAMGEAGVAATTICNDLAESQR